jgi:hypothetical protein
MQESREILTWLQTLALGDQTKAYHELLINNGFDSWQAIALAQLQDLHMLNIRVGHARLLFTAIQSLSRSPFRESFKYPKSSSVPAITSSVREDVESVAAAPAVTSPISVRPRRQCLFEMFGNCEEPECSKGWGACWVKRASFTKDGNGRSYKYYLDDARLYFFSNSTTVSQLDGLRDQYSKNGDKKRNLHRWIKPKFISSHEYCHMYRITSITVMDIPSFAKAMETGVVVPFNKSASGSLSLPTASSKIECRTIDQNKALVPIHVGFCTRDRRFPIFAID